MTFWVQLSQAFLTPVIACVGIYIGLVQLKSNGLKLRMDRFDRRSAVYREVVTVVTQVLRDKNITFDQLIQFRSGVADADFLFRPDIAQYVDEMYSRGLKLSRANSQLRDVTQVAPAGYDHVKVATEINVQFAWFDDQLSAAKEKFRPYLDISK